MLLYPCGVHHLFSTDVARAVAGLLTDVLGPGRAGSVGELTESGRDLLSALAALGWSADGTPDLLVVAAGTGLAADSGPAVVVAGHTEPVEARPWPGWDAAMTAAGYVGCGRAGALTWYASADRVDSLGPRLGSLTTPSSALVEELVAWRTAALTRWAERAEGESGKPNKELRAELQAAKEAHSAMEATLSWRLTAPLRAVRGFRRLGARRR